MPYLQLDVPGRYPAEGKRDLAQRMGAQFAGLMQTTPDLVNIAFRELGEGGVWNCGEGAPVPSAVLSLGYAGAALPGSACAPLRPCVPQCVRRSAWIRSS